MVKEKTNDTDVTQRTILVHKHFLEIVLVHGDEQHDAEAGSHAEELQQKLGCLAAVLGPVGGRQLGDHIHQRNIQEQSSRHGKHPRRRFRLVSDHNPNQHPDEAQYRREKIVVHRIPGGHSRLQQHGKISQLVGQFVTEDGDCGGEPTGNVVGESSPNGHSVGKVVQPIAHDDHPGYRGEGTRWGVHVAVGVRMAVVLGFVLAEDDRVVLRWALV